MAVGANSIWLMGLAGAVDQKILLYLPAAIIGSILPDIDATSAKIHYAAGGIFGIFKGSFYGKFFHHRGLMHSFFVAWLFFMIIWVLSANSYPLLAPIFALSYASHSIIDGFNAPVGYLYPFIHKTFALLPKSLRFRGHSPGGTLLMFAGIAGLLIFFAAYYHQLTMPQLISPYYH